MREPRSFDEKNLKSVRTFLSRWGDAHAQMYELTVSIKSLRLVIHRPNSPGNLLLACLGPIFIKGPVRWQNCDVQVDLVSLPDNEGMGYRVYDETVGFEVICGALEVAENVKLW